MWQHAHYIPYPNGCANANVQHSNKHPKPKNHFHRWHRPLFKGEKDNVTAGGYTYSLSRYSMPQRLTTTPNEPDTLVTIFIKLNVLGNSKTITCICLGGMSICADNTNSPGHRMEMSRGQADESKGWMNTLNMLYTAEIVEVSHGDSAATIDTTLLICTHLHSVHWCSVHI